MAGPIRTIRYTRKEDRLIDYPTKNTVNTRRIPQRLRHRITQAQKTAALHQNGMQTRTVQKMDPLIERHRSQILALAKKNGLREVRVFGSMARGDATEASDVDLLVTRTPNTSGLAIFGLEIDVQALLGRPVEVLTEGCLPDTFRERVMREAVPLD